jgi:hypothetical protein
VFLPAILLLFVADVRGCVCDPTHPDTMAGRECSLTLVTMGQGLASPVFFIKDSNPSKANRLLAIPHSFHHTLDDMTAAERTAYWKAAIAKAREVWGDDWGIAINSLAKRSQCQLHAHIGKLLATVDRSGGVLVARPEDIPVPPNGDGIWIHPEGVKFRVHVGDPSPELGLMR